MQFSQDQDYVSAFQRLAHIVLDIEVNGVTPQRLMQKGIACLDIGDIAEARRCFGRVAVTQPHNAEAHYLLAQSLILQTAQAHHLIPVGCLYDGPTLTPEALLRDAVAALADCLALNPHDEEARLEHAALYRIDPDDAEALQAFLDAHHQ